MVLLYILRCNAFPDDLLLPLLAFVPSSWTPLHEPVADVAPLPLTAFQVGDCVTARGLTATPELNGAQGRVVSVGEGTQGNRIGVDFGEHGRKAARPGNLVLINLSPDRARAIAEAQEAVKKADAEQHSDDDETDALRQRQRLMSLALRRYAARHQNPNPPNP